MGVSLPLGYLLLLGRGLLPRSSHAASTLKTEYQQNGMYCAHNYLTDHLGSIVSALDSSGNLLSQQRYLPFGEVRADVGAITQTDFGYTSQRNLAELGLMDYWARFYSPYLNRFTQPDTIVPDLANPQNLNRYAYSRNNPITYSDPSGHLPCIFTPNSCLPGFLNMLGDLIHSIHNIVSYTQAGSATEQAWELVDEWYNETGDENRIFGPENPLTQEIIDDYQMDDFKLTWAQADYQLPFTYSPTIDEREEDSSFFEGAGVMLREHVWELGLSTLGFYLNDNIDPVGGTIGSFDSVTVSDAGNGQVRFEVYNEMGIASLTRPPTKDEGLLPNQDRDSWGPGGTTIQRFYWYESIPIQKSKKYYEVMGHE